MEQKYKQSHRKTYPDIPTSAMLKSFFVDFDHLSYFFMPYNEEVYNCGTIFEYRFIQKWHNIRALSNIRLALA